MRRSDLFTLLLVALLFSGIEAQAQSDTAFWRKLDGPSGAVITSFVETDSGALLAGTMSGLLRSDNAGRSWVGVSDELDQLEVWSLERSGAGTMYAATTNGIYASEDDGTSWRELEATALFERTLDIVLAPGNRVFVTTDQGVYLTEDDGLTWERKQQGIPADLFVQELVQTENATLIGSTVAGGLYKTSDFGATWVEANTGISDLYIRSLYADESGNLWAGTRFGLVYRSQDQGDSWTEIGNGLASLDIRALVETTDGMVAGASTGDEEGVVGGIYRYNESNSNWEKQDIFDSSAEIRSLHTLKNGELIAGTSGRSVYRSENGGNNWLPYEMGMSNTNVWGLFPTRDGRMYVASYKAGFNRSSDNGQSWETLTFSPNQESLYDFTDAPNGDLYVATNQYNVYRSQDDGLTWDLVAEDLLTPHITTTASGTVLLGGSGKIYRSVDSGDSWQTIRLPTEPQESPLTTDVLEFEIAEDGTIYTAIHDYGVFISHDDGQTWEMSDNEGLGERNIISFGRTTGGKLLLSFSSRWFESPAFADMEYDAGIMISEDDGDTWTLLPEVPEPGVKIIFEFTSAVVTEDVYAVYNYPDGNGEWIPRGYKYSMDQGVWEELPFASNELGYFAFDAEGYLYSGTHGDGVFRSQEIIALPFSAVSNEEIAGRVDTDFVLEQNYPNPFATSTTIRYKIPKAAPVSVVVYDLLGREVMTLQSGTQPAGNHELQFEAAHLPTGIYYYQLDTSEQRITRSMILVK